MIRHRISGGWIRCRNEGQMPTITDDQIRILLEDIVREIDYDIYKEMFVFNVCYDAEEAIVKRWLYERGIAVEK